MKVEMRRWLTEPYCDIQQYRTQITIRDDNGFVIAMSFPGHLTRKKALQKAWESIAADVNAGRLSPSFRDRFRQKIGGAR